MQFPDSYVPLNGCSSCGLDFASVGAFDAHRTGVHDYTFSEGMRMDPSREDGRRCLDLDELPEHGLEYRKTRQGVDCWGLVISEQARNRLSALRGLALAPREHPAGTR